MENKLKDGFKMNFKELAITSIIWTLGAIVGVIAAPFYWKFVIAVGQL